MKISLSVCLCDLHWLQRWTLNSGCVKPSRRAGMPPMTCGRSLCDGNCGAMGPAVDEVQQQPAMACLLSLFVGSRLPRRRSRSANGAHMPSVVRVCDQPVI
jgi:hypothetical protein